MRDRSERACIGFRAHGGWAAAVCLAGPVSEPFVLERARLLLTDGPLPCEPYHAAKGLGPEPAESLVRQAGERAQELAADWIRSLGPRLELVGAGIVLGSGRPEFTLKQALSTHAAMHNAEGWLFREALMRACEECSLPLSGALEMAAYEQAAAALGVSVTDLEARTRELGRELGPPWGRDQKLATAVAWMALAPGNQDGEVRLTSHRLAHSH
jgi:hypothetical protein